MPQPSTTFQSPTVDPLDLPEMLRPAIEAAADESERCGDIPAQLYAELRDAGAFRLLTPREQGGLETPLTTTMKVYEAFGRIDASVAWIVWNANFGCLGALLPESGVARLWAAGEPAFANSGMPGRAKRTDGGFRISGRWRIVSGVHRAEWVSLVAIVMDGDMPATNSSGGPDVRFFLTHKNALTVLDTWNVSGMRGSGSHDVVVEDAFVPDELVAPVDLPSRIDRPLYRGYPQSLVVPGCTAIVLGVAQAAIDEMVRMAPGKKDPSGKALSEQHRARVALARSDTSLRAARLLLHSVLGDLQAVAELGGTVSTEQKSDLWAAMAHAAQVCRKVLVDMYELGSSASIYRSEALERIFRDGMVALQHANHSAKHFESVGAVLFGDAPLSGF
ncbi:acyl-CoA dehydrogenase family protein [Streptomyces sp. NPDC085937]|uniref:acyl-CoA dehydrogenase family protein n=1 Tax=Streptomyces sp. NPDC085937 TaxID=3365742 RepID=UPI0037D717D3